MTVSEETMESAAELHEARVLRGRIEVKEAQLAALEGGASEARARCLAELETLKADYRRVLANQADRDYRRRRCEWRAQQSGNGSRSRRTGRACA
jgi:hypothetical protein